MLVFSGGEVGLDGGVDTCGNVDRKVLWLGSQTMLEDYTAICKRTMMCHTVEHVSVDCMCIAAALHVCNIVIILDQIPTVQF